jgi:hypothetical protein
MRTNPEIALLDTFATARLERLYYTAHAPGSGQIEKPSVEDSAWKMGGASLLASCIQFGAAAVVTSNAFIKVSTGNGA